MFISNHFTIGDVDILGIETMQRGQVLEEVNDIFEQKSFGFLSLNNYFLFPNDELRASLYEKFPKIGGLDVQKINPDGLEIKIEERESIGVWCSMARTNAEDKREITQIASDCFYFDKMGVIFEEAPRSIGSLMLSVYDERGGAPSLGESALDGWQIAFFQDIQNIILRNFPFGVKKFIISGDGEFEFIASENWRVLLDNKETSEYQLSNLKYLLDEKVGIRRRELEYVDLRLGNRVYYRYR